MRLIDAMVDLPAVVMGRRSEVLAWNRLAHALLAGHLDFRSPGRPADRPNLTRMLFRDPHTRELYPRWSEEAARSVASLHLIAGQHRDDPELADLVGELALSTAPSSPRCGRGTRSTTASSARSMFHHPEVGEFTLEFQALHLPDDSGQRLLIYTAAPGARHKPR